MRTVFEDTEARLNQEDAKGNDSGKYLPVMLWTFALLFSLGSWSAYYYAVNRKPPEPPPPPVSLQDPRQIGTLLNHFGQLAKDDKWDEAQQLLSSGALQRLTEEKKTLRESLFGPRAKDDVIEAATTGGGSSTETTVRQDCVFYFSDRDYQIIPLTVVLENGKLLVNSW